LASEAARSYRCENPEGEPNEVITKDGWKYKCTKKGWKPIGCPSVIEIDYVVYRFFDKRPTPCRGSIDQCVYISHWQEFCMNGIYPLVTPYRLPFRAPNFNTALESGGAIPQAVYVTTYLNSTSPGEDSFNMSTAGLPVQQYTWYSHLFMSTLLCSGFTWTDFAGTLRDPIGDASSDQSLSVVVPVATGDINTYGHITEVVGRTGDLVNRVEFAVQQVSDPTEVSTYTCGGIYGSAKDATPDPSKYGRCFMTTIAGTTKPGISNTLATLEFLWFCEGK